MICTSSYNNWKSKKYRTYSISGNRGSDANYTGKSYPELAPKKEFWEIWHNNIGVIPKKDNTRYYIEQYYKQVLSKLDPEEIDRQLNGSVLLCYENNNLFCHRHIVAAWLELLLDIEVPELKIKNDIAKIVNKPEYVKEYLEDIMKEHKEMRGFNSLRALHLLEQAENLEKKADELKKLTGKYFNSYIQSALRLKEEANNAETKYNELMRTKSPRKKRI